MKVVGEGPVIPGGGMEVGCQDMECVCACFRTLWCGACGVCVCVGGCLCGLFAGSGGRKAGHPPESLGLILQSVSLGLFTSLPASFAPEIFIC